MSITVVISRDDAGAPMTKDHYETGVKFSVEGGDLSIVSGKPQLVAYYGSGNWMSVHVDDNVVTTTEKPADSDGGSDFGSDFSFDSDSDSSDVPDDSSSSELDALLADDS